MATTWEYSIQYYGNDMRPVLDAAGLDGWELVSHEPARSRLIFKRPKGGAR